MKRIIASAVSIALCAGCSESTEPSEVYRDQLLLIDPVTGSIDARINVETLGYGAPVVSPDGRFMYLRRLSSAISVIDLESGTVSAAIQLPGNSFYSMAMAVNADGSDLYAVCIRSGVTNNVFYKVSTSDFSIADSLDLGGSMFTQIAPRPGTELVYLPTLEKGIVVFNTSTMTFTDTLNVQVYALGGLYFSDSGNEFYVIDGNELSACNSDTGDILLSRGFPGGIVSFHVPHGSSSFFLFWGQSYGTSNYETHLLELDKETFATIDETENYIHGSQIVYLEQARRLFIYPTSDNDIAVADMPGFQAAGEIQVDDYMQAMTASPSGDRLYCTVFYDSNPDIDW